MGQMKNQKQELVSEWIFPIGGVVENGQTGGGKGRCSNQDGRHGSAFGGKWRAGYGWGLKVELVEHRL